MSFNSEILPQQLASNGKLTQAQVDAWQENGYLILKSFFPKDEVVAFNQFIDELWTTRKELKVPITVDVHLDGTDVKRQTFADVEEQSRERPYKLNDLYLNYAQVRRLNLDKKLCRILDQLLDGRPLICNTLNMEHGTQQPDHIDTFFMPPRVENKMLATWISLDNVDQNNGPLRFYPGSHKITPYLFSNGKLNMIPEEMPKFYEYIHSEMENRGITFRYFEAEPGDVLIWHAQLLHGGEKIKTGKSRKSLVTHYFRVREHLDQIRRVRPHNIRGFYLWRPHEKKTYMEKEKESRNNT